MGSSLKVVGALFSNKEEIDKLNTDLAIKNFYWELQKQMGFKGTILQKIYIVNKILFSKLWYLSQNFKMDEKNMEKILSKACSFIYSGENERPIRPLNFRPKNKGGLGLINPLVKAKAFLMKSMMKDFADLDFDRGKINQVHGWNRDFRIVFEKLGTQTDIKIIYDELLTRFIYRNGSLIPSRNEKNKRGVKWKNAWQNLTILRGLNPTETCFAWKLTQDMVEVGRRKHRKGAVRGCGRIGDDSRLCNVLETLEHCVMECGVVRKYSLGLIRIIESLIGRTVAEREIVCLSFKCRKLTTLKVALWFAVKTIHEIFSNRERKPEIWRKVLEELEWRTKKPFNFGCKDDWEKLKRLLKFEIENQRG